MTLRARKFLQEQGYNEPVFNDLAVPLLVKYAELCLDIQAKIIVSQPVVSINEGQQNSSNKKEPEVALLDFFSWLNKNGMIKNLYLMPIELIERYKKSSNGC